MRAGSNFSSASGSLPARLALSSDLIICGGGVTGGEQGGASGARHLLLPRGRIRAEQCHHERREEHAALLRRVDHLRRASRAGRRRRSLGARGASRGARRGSGRWLAAARGAPRGGWGQGRRRGGAARQRAPLVSGQWLLPHVGHLLPELLNQRHLLAK
eukprot:scaffold57420_cov64-Phaeocystis_antarctica.AAC.7